MKSVLFILGVVFASSSAAHVKRDAIVPAFYTPVSAPVYSSQYVATSPLFTSQYVATSPVVSAAYVAAPNPVIARASRVLGEPGFVSRYVAAPVVATPAEYDVAAPVRAVETVTTVNTVPTPAKIVNPSTPILVA